MKARSRLAYGNCGLTNASRQTTGEKPIFLFTYLSRIAKTPAGTQDDSSRRREIIRKRKKKRTRLLTDVAPPSTPPDCSVIRLTPTCSFPAKKKQNNRGETQGSLRETHAVGAQRSITTGIAPVVMFRL